MLSHILLRSMRLSDRLLGKPLVVALAFAWAVVGGAAGCAHNQAKPNMKAIHYQAEGARSYARGDLDRAAGQFSLALEYEPRMAEARNGLGLVALARGDKATAEAQFRSALGLNEELAEAHLNLGFIMMDRGDLDDAMTEFRQALAIDPGFGAARLAVGETLLRLNRPEDARWELVKLCEVEPQNARAQAAYALVLARVDRISSAEAAAEKALALDHNLPAAHRARAEILKRRGDMPGAIDELRLVLQGEPMSVDDRVTLVTVLVAAGQSIEAEQELAGLERTAPRRAEVAFVRAYVELNKEANSTAISSARRALRLRHNYPEARMVLAEALLRTGQNDEGRQQVKAFLEEAPSSMATERRMAQTFLDR